MPNIYYTPEKYGLTVFGELEDPGACYSYDTLVVWQDDAGRLLWTSDSGCSCPEPFDGIGLRDLDVVTPLTWDAFVEAVTSHALPYDYSHGEAPPPDPLAADKADLIRRVGNVVGW